LTKGEKTVVESKISTSTIIEEKTAKSEPPESGDIFDNEDDVEALEALAAAEADEIEKSVKENVPPKSNESTPSEEDKE
jgi:hypothetical protein